MLATWTVDALVHLLEGADSDDFALALVMVRSLEPILIVYHKLSILATANDRIMQTCTDLING